MDLKAALVYLLVVPGVVFSLLLIVAKSFLPIWIMLAISCLVGVLFYAKTYMGTFTIPTFLTTKATETETTEPTEKKSLWKRFSGSYWELAFWTAVFIAGLYILICT